MATKFSEFVEDTAPAITDFVVGLTGADNKKMQIQNLTKRVQLDVGGGYPHSPGQISFDPVTQTILADTGFNDVSVNIGQETHVRFFNDTGSTITNGTVINAAGVDTANDVLKGIVADITSPATSSSIIGVATADVANGAVGLATKYGEIRGLDTSLLSTSGILYAGVGGGFTQTFPNYPNSVVILGSVIKSAVDGIIFVDTQVFNRGTGSKSYSFTSNGVLAGTYYVGGFYDGPDTDTTLSSMASTQPLGTGNNHYEARPFAVFAGGATVSGGVAGLRVRGATIDTTTGIITTNNTSILSEDITANVTNEYAEPPLKFVGSVLYELYTVSGVPVVGAPLSFNYGFAKYENLRNIDFTVTGFEVVGTAGATDNGFNVELLHHKPSGWTYAASGFVPGDGVIAQLSDDAPYDALINGENFAFKRPALNQYIDGATDEGVVIRITANANNSIQSMNIHLTGVVEQLVF